MSSEEYVFPAGNGYDRIEQILKQVYGDRADFKRSIARFLYGGDYSIPDENGRSLESIKEVSLEEIKATIARETFFRDLANNLCKQFDKDYAEQNLTVEDSLAIAGVFGMAPSQYERKNTLFPDLVDLSVDSEDQAKSLLETVINNAPLLQMAVNTMMDRLRPNHVLRFHGRDLLSQGYARNYFRGENAYYKKSVASIYRQPLSCDEFERKKQLTISQCRIIEFSTWLNQLSFVKSWPYGDVFHGAIAQHYGIPTNALDITSDLKTALFFACCKYSDKTGWQPLEESDFSESDSRPVVAKLGGDSRYGILFFAPADICDMSEEARNGQPHITGVTPVGAQPFLRCQNQYGYMIETGEVPGSNQPFDLYHAIPFSAIKFHHSKELCDWIFEEMQQGTMIYPEYNNVDLSSIVEEIKRTKEFSVKSLYSSFAFLGYSDEQEKLRNALETDGYCFLESVTRDSDDYIALIERDWEKSNYPKLIINSSVRPSFCI